MKKHSLISGEQGSGKTTLANLMTMNLQTEVYEFKKFKEPVSAGVQAIIFEGIETEEDLAAFFKMAETDGISFRPVFKRIQITVRPVYIGVTQMPPAPGEELPCNHFKLQK